MTDTPQEPWPGFDPPKGQDREQPSPEPRKSAVKRWRLPACVFTACIGAAAAIAASDEPVLDMLAKAWGRVAPSASVSTAETTPDMELAPEEVRASGIDVPPAPTKPRPHPKLVEGGGSLSRPGQAKTDGSGTSPSQIQGAVPQDRGGAMAARPSMPPSTGSGGSPPAPGAVPGPGRQASNGWVGGTPNTGPNTRPGRAVIAEAPASGDRAPAGARSRPQAQALPQPPLPATTPPEMGVGPLSDDESPVVEPVSRPNKPSGTSPEPDAGPPAGLIAELSFEDRVRIAPDVVEAVPPVPGQSPSPAPDRRETVTTTRDTVETRRATPFEPGDETARMATLEGGPVPPTAPPVDPGLSFEAMLSDVERMRSLYNRDYSLPPGSPRAQAPGMAGAPGAAGAPGLPGAPASPEAVTEIEAARQTFAETYSAPPARPRRNPNLWTDPRTMEQAPQSAYGLPGAADDPSLPQYASRDGVQDVYRAMQPRTRGQVPATMPPTQMPQSASPMDQARRMATRQGGAPMARDLKPLADPFPSSQDLAQRALSGAPKPETLTGALKQTAIDAVQEMPGRAMDAAEAYADAAIGSQLAPLAAGMEVLPEFDSAGRYLAQLFATPNEQATCRAWTDLKSQAPQLFQGAEQMVVQADDLYKLRAGSFADQVQAQIFCDALKAKGQSCFVTER